MHNQLLRIRCHLSRADNLLTSNTVGQGDDLLPSDTAGQGRVPLVPEPGVQVYGGQGIMRLDSGPNATYAERACVCHPTQVIQTLRDYQNNTLVSSYKMFKASSTRDSHSTTSMEAHAKARLGLIKLNARASLDEARRSVGSSKAVFTTLSIEVSLCCVVFPCKISSLNSFLHGADHQEHTQLSPSLSQVHLRTSDVRRIRRATWPRICLLHRERSTVCGLASTRPCCYCVTDVLPPGLTLLWRTPSVKMRRRRARMPPCRPACDVGVSVEEPVLRWRRRSNKRTDALRLLHTSWPLERQVTRLCTCAVQCIISRNMHSRRVLAGLSSAAVGEEELIQLFKNFPTAVQGCAQRLAALLVPRPSADDNCSRGGTILRFCTEPYSVLNVLGYEPDYPAFRFNRFRLEIPGLPDCQVNQAWLSGLTRLVAAEDELRVLTENPSGARLVWDGGAQVSTVRLVVASIKPCHVMYTWCRCRTMKGSSSLIALARSADLLSARGRPSGTAISQEGTDRHLSAP